MLSKKTRNRAADNGSGFRNCLSNAGLLMILLGAMGSFIFLLEHDFTNTNQLQFRNPATIRSEKVPDKLVQPLPVTLTNLQAFPPKKQSGANAVHNIKIKKTTPENNINVKNEKQQQQHNDQNTFSTLDNTAQNSKYAYITLISGIDSKFRYRGFLYNCLIMLKALRMYGSTADFIAMIGYSEKDITPFQEDIELLRSHGVIIYTLPRLLDETHKLNFAEMALLKITPFSLTQYERIQYFDGDVMPTKNMDCFFELNVNVFTVGAVSPLNSGWFLAIPNQEAYLYMKEKAIWRLGRDWDTIQGWAEPMPDNMFYRGGKVCDKWLFNGADMDQGLFTHYFVINHGQAMLIDTQLRKVRSFEKGILHQPDTIVDMKIALKCCDGWIPTQHFAHFTGRSKPWLVPDLSAVQPTKTNGNLILWRKHLDELHLSINSSTISELKLVPPLGYFNANFPKGGYKTSSKNATEPQQIAKA